MARLVVALFLTLAGHSTSIASLLTSSESLAIPALRATEAAEVMHPQGQLWVDCRRGSDAATGRAATAALRTLPKALSLWRIQRTQSPTVQPSPFVINVVGGLCDLSTAALSLSRAESGWSAQSPLVLRGDGRTALSGGRVVGNFTKAVGRPGLVASLPGDFPADEIKGCRLGEEALRWSRWPKKVGEGLSTPNWMFAMPWSVSSCPAPCNGATGRTMQTVGLDPAALPSNMNLSALVGSYVHILGNGEKDVLGQVSRILSVNQSDPAHPTATFLAHEYFTVGQRMYLENVPWELVPGEFFHDSQRSQLYIRSDLAETTVLEDVKVVVPVLETVLELQSAKHIVLSNLTFLDSTFFADGQWNGPARAPSDAVVRINNSSDVIVESCNFLASVLGYGIAVGNASSNISILSCLFDEVGQGGVIMYGVDGPVNTKPTAVHVSHCVMQSLGQSLDHVAGVAMRAAADCRVSHNRISGSTRYGLQVDTFFTGDQYAGNSRMNVFEYNIIHDTCRTTTDCGAIESLGVGDPHDDGGGDGWWTGNIFRFNNVSRTIGSSSSDGKHVCVHGQPSIGCRNLVWSVYFDDTNSGNIVESNYLGATIHGAFLDNLGGNNSHQNNVFYSEDENDGQGPQSSLFLANFGAPGFSKKHPVQRNISGSTMKHNIFYFTSKGTSLYASVYGSWSNAQLKPSGADYNLFFSPTVDVSTYRGFPGGKTLTTWQGGAAAAPRWPPSCMDLRGPAGKLQLGSGSQCTRWGWDYNTTDLKFRARNTGHWTPPNSSTSNFRWAMTVDCVGSWMNCARGSPTRICLDPDSDPWPPIPPAVDNAGWIVNQTAFTIQAVASGHCISSSGTPSPSDPHGIYDGAAVDLMPCVAGAGNQRWRCECHCLQCLVQVDLILQLHTCIDLSLQ